MTPGRGQGPPTRRSGPHGNADRLEIADAAEGSTVPTVAAEGDRGENLAPVLPLRGLDDRRRAELQTFLDGVPISLGLAAGRASVWLPADVGARLARERLEELRREWHRLVDASIDRAVSELARPA
jgi:hypothetical protein